MRIRSGALAVLVGGVLTIASTAAMALPSLQLYIDPSQQWTEWDSATETWVTHSLSFNLSAFAIDQDHGSTAGNAFYSNQKKAILSIALSGDFDGTEDPTTFGTVTVDGNQVPNMLTTWTYGTPPITDVINPDLPGHSIYPTWYAEYMFNFGKFGANVFDTNADDPNFQVNADIGYRKDLAIELTGLDMIEAVGAVHFDLYTVDANGELYAFAPPSHDAEYQVAEPGTIVMFGTAFFGLGMISRRRRRRKAA